MFKELFQEKADLYKEKVKAFYHLMYFHLTWKSICFPKMLKKLFLPLSPIALLNAVYANGFQMVVSGPQAKPIKDAPIISLQVIHDLRMWTGQVNDFSCISQQNATQILTICPESKEGSAWVDIAILYPRQYSSKRDHLLTMRTNYRCEPLVEKVKKRSD